MPILSFFLHQNQLLACNIKMLFNLQKFIVYQTINNNIVKENPRCDLEKIECDSALDEVKFYNNQKG